MNSGEKVHAVKIILAGLSAFLIIFAIIRLTLAYLADRGLIILILLGAVLVIQTLVARWIVKNRNKNSN